MTAITRADSQNKLPEGVNVKKVDYNKQGTLVEALQGQDALVITLSGYVPKDTQGQLINAAGEAGVAWILPNEWSPDTANEALVKDVFVFQPNGEQYCYHPSSNHNERLFGQAKRTKSVHVDFWRSSCICTVRNTR